MESLDDVMNVLVNNKTKPTEHLTNQEASLILEDVIDCLIEVGNGTTDEMLHEACNKLFDFRNKWFNHRCSKKEDGWAYIDMLLTDKNRKLYYVNPVDGVDADGNKVLGHEETSISVGDAINHYRKMKMESASKFDVELDDRNLLQGFIAMHWASVRN